MAVHTDKRPPFSSPGPVAPAPPAGSVLGRIFWRLVWVPGLLLRWLQAASRPAPAKALLDQELRLYAEMFPGQFLHYGYFDNPDIAPEALSFGDIDRAQTEYARRLIGLIGDRSSPVLDVGCGMGGLAFMLHDEGVEVVPLTPDRYQAAHIRNQQSGLTVIESCFETFDMSAYRQHFGTVLTSESLQYLNLDISLPRIRALLKPGGQWVACDYFRMHDGERSSGHIWAEFCDKLREHGFRITQQEDITGNVLPTLKFASMLAQRFVLPVHRYVEDKARSKRPVLYYLLEAAFERGRYKLQKGARTIDPLHFAANKRYMRLVIEPDENLTT